MCVVSVWSLCFSLFANQPDQGRSQEGREGEERGSSRYHMSSPVILVINKQQHALNNPCPPMTPLLHPSRLIYSVGLFLSLLVIFFLYQQLPQCTNCNDDNRQGNQHHLAVLVPFRDRFDELLEFVPHMGRFLTRQGISFSIHVLNQKDNWRFNRASLINAGYQLVQGEADYLVMHDVDLLPLNDDLRYDFPVHGTVTHIASPDLHPKYHYDTFVGGILIMTASDFESINGMSNKYYGWGLEDDELYVRLKERELKVRRPKGITTGINDTFIHLHGKNRKRDTAKLFNQREVTRRRDRETGVSNVSFVLLQKRNLSIDNFSCVVYDIQLNCDINLTPWCQRKDSLNNVTRSSSSTAASVS